MGHTRLGRIPKLRKWQDVVAAFSANQGSSAETVSRVADLTLAAAEPALARAANDPALQQCFYAMAKLVLAAREDDWQGALRGAGFDVPSNASVFDLATALHGYVDDALLAQGRTSDVGEIALRAMGQAIVESAEPSSRTLFGTTPDDVRRAVYDLSTKKGFASLGQHFFGNFLARFLNSYVSRISATAAGTDKVGGVADLTKFNADLNHHCVQSARILRDFCGEWYSKTEYERGIDPENSARFVGVAVGKLAAELRRQRSGE